VVIVATERTGTGLAKPGAKRGQAAERVKILNDSKENVGLEPGCRRLYYVASTWF
jgi:hypothetical protein